MIEVPATSSAREATRVEALGVIRPLIGISKSTRTLMDLRLHEIGIVIGQDSLILVLTEDEDISIGRAADLVAVRPSTVSKMVDRLVRQGLVKRSQQNDDARLTGIRLTAAGSKMRSRVLTIYAEVEEQILKVLGNSQPNVVPALDRFSHVIRQRLSRLR